MKTFKNVLKVGLLAGLVFLPAMGYSQLQPLVPFDLRGDLTYEKQGTHDANNIRTLFYNFGMVGDYPSDPLHVDYSIFHSVEIPKGSGENYSDGITPFVLARVVQGNGRPAYIMETGYRERQGTSPYYNRVMRFEPRPGYFQQDPTINKAESPAMSNDPRTWPEQWIDKLDDPDDPGWSGSWDGYFGKAPAADQESYVVYDDQYYDAWDFFPDNRDAGQDPLKRRRGLGLRVEQRGFQWANPQAGNVIFWHYDIVNEATTSYIDNIIFGLYMDSGVGGSAIGVDGIPESDDDNAFYDKAAGLNLVYTWDKNGNGSQGPTGYLGYAYLETPGNPFDGIDNDQDGITDEKRDGGPGERIEGQTEILDYLQTHYDMQKFEAYYGPITDRPAFRAGIWWTGDEDMNWVAEFNDTGADGVFDSGDTGERDGIPTAGEPNFDKTDIDESDQIGLTGFKMNRIRAGAGNPSTDVDNIVFFDDGKQWPERLYEYFTTGPQFDQALVLNYNIGFLFASGPFQLQAGKRERFSLALGFGKDLRELRNTTRVVQQIYKANYQFAVPPPMPTLQAYEGDGFVRLTWNDKAERAFDPITNRNDFEGYRIYRSTDPTFLDPKVISTATGSGPIGNGRPLAQFDLKDGIEGFTKTTVEGVAYFLGEDNGITHTFTDSTVTNGQLYYYALTSYDTGSDSIQIYPSENAIAVSQTLRGGTILPQNVVEVRPNKPVRGYTSAETGDIQRVAGDGYGTVKTEVLNSELVPDDHIFGIEFLAPEDSVRATSYAFFDEALQDTFFTTGHDFEGLGIGPSGKGILPVIWTPKTIIIDSLNTGFTSGSNTNEKLKVRYAEALPISLKRPGFPDDVQIVFADEPVDTSLAAVGVPAKPARFRIFAKTDSSDIQLNFRFRDTDGDGTISVPSDYVEIVTYSLSNPKAARSTWRVDMDTTGQSSDFSAIPPSSGDVFNLKILRPFGAGDKFTFNTRSQTVNLQAAKNSGEKPYVVPNPYVNSASFEPQRFAVSGRGERRIEFRGLPMDCTVRIFTITGELVQTLHQSGQLTEGFVAWDLRTKDNLEAAPGLYIYHVDSKDTEPYIGKFAIIK